MANDTTTGSPGAGGFKERVAAVFRSRTRDQWCEALEGTDVCFAPVLTLAEAREHPHAVARDAFVEIAGKPQPRPAPRFSRTPPDVPGPPTSPAEETPRSLADWGFSEAAIESLRAAKAIP